MLETLISNRIKFHKKGTQRAFILEAKKSLGMTGFALSQKLLVSQRTLTSWISEKLRMSYVSAQKLSKLAKIAIPSDFTIIKWSDHLKNIGKVGGKNRIAKYGRIALDEEYRNKQWKQWWKKIGQHKKKPTGFQSLIKIKIPRKSERLAEFVGIMLGDGGVAPYHICITLSNKETAYAQYIATLIDDLFGLQVKTYKKRTAQAVDIVVQRKQLVDFCQKLGLVKGNKVRQQVDIPSWIKSNGQFAIACLRGLVDTDGCFYTNSYYVNGKRYSYFKICFTNFSLPLIRSVAEILKSLEIDAIRSKGGKDIRIVNRKSVAKYIEIVGSHNQKHLGKVP